MTHGCSINALPATLASLIARPIKPSAQRTGYRKVRIMMDKLPTEAGRVDGRKQPKRTPATDPQAFSIATMRGSSSKDLKVLAGRSTGMYPMLVGAILRGRTSWSWSWYR